MKQPPSRLVLGVALAVTAAAAVTGASACRRTERAPAGEQATPTTSAAVETTAVAAPATPPRACPGFGQPQDVGTFQTKELREVSGLVVSHRNPNVLFAHNDSGDAARIFALSRTGHTLGVYRLVGANALDWEDMTEGPAPHRDGPYLYIADTGDNRSVRPFVTIYRIAEPAVSPSQPLVKADVQGVEAFELRYPDHAHDVETILVDPKSADVVLISKERDGPAVIFTAPPLDTPGAPIALTKVGTLSFGRKAISGRLATSGDVTPTGDGVAVRTYSDAWLYARAPGTKLWEALLTTPCALPLALEPQGESIAFTANADGYFTVSEGEHATLHYVGRVTSDAGD